MKALVTGGAGFIGSTLVDRLLAEGHSVIVIDNLASGKLANLERALDEHPDLISFVELDIRDAKTREVIANAGADVVFHLAAQMDVRVSVSMPVFDAEVNVLGALNVLEGAREGGVRKLVFASSGGTIYGDRPDGEYPLDESTPQHPLSPYGITKKVFGDYLHAYNELYGLEYAAMALANVYGPRQDPHGEAGVVAIFSQRLLAGQPCTIFGTGLTTRDYVYVDDVVDAFVRAAGAGLGIYNIGTGAEITSRGLYDALAEGAGANAEPDYADARDGEIRRSVLDYTRAKSDLGWEPRVPLHEGVKSVLTYFRDRQATGADSSA